MKFCKIALPVLAGLLLFSSLGLAQSALGSIAVAVTDASDAAVVGAKVTITGADTNVKRTEITGAEGTFTFANLEPGNYVVSVTATGFKELRSSIIALTGAQSTRFEAKLQIGIDALGRTIRRLVKTDVPQ